MEARHRHCCSKLIERGDGERTDAHFDELSTGRASVPLRWKKRPKHARKVVSYILAECRVNYDGVTDEAVGNDCLWVDEVEEKRDVSGTQLRGAISARSNFGQDIVLRRVWICLALLIVAIPSFDLAVAICIDAFGVEFCPPTR